MDTGGVMVKAQLPCPRGDEAVLGPVEATGQTPRSPAWLKGSCASLGLVPDTPHPHGPPALPSRIEMGLPPLNFPAA